MEHYLRQGLVSDSKVLDIRQVDVSARSLDFVSFAESISDFRRKNS